MTREEMMDEVIRTLGFENKWTIWFCELCENPAYDLDILITNMTFAIGKGIRR